MLSVLVVLIIVVTTLNISNRIAIQNMTNSILEVLIENKGQMPDINFDSEDNPVFKFKMTKANKFESSYFLVHTDKYNNIIQIDIQHTNDLTYSEAKDYVNAVINSANSTSGRIDNYKYLCDKGEAGKLYAFFGLWFSISSAFCLFEIFNLHFFHKSAYNFCVCLFHIR
jgi:hypothetical protein